MVCAINLQFSRTKQPICMLRKDVGGARKGRMWSPSTAICCLVNGGVLMVCHVVGRRKGYKTFLEVFGRGTYRGRQSREEAESVGWVHVEVRGQSKA